MDTALGALVEVDGRVGTVDGVAENPLGDGIDIWSILFDDGSDVSVAADECHLITRIERPSTEDTPARLMRKLADWVDGQPMSVGAHGISAGSHLREWANETERAELRSKRLAEATRFLREFDERFTAYVETDNDLDALADLAGYVRAWLLTS